MRIGSKVRRRTNPCYDVGVIILVYKGDWFDIEWQATGNLQLHFAEQLEEISEEAYAHALRLLADRMVNMLE